MKNPLFCINNDLGIRDFPLKRTVVNVAFSDIRGSQNSRVPSPHVTRQATAVSVLCCEVNVLLQGQAIIDS
ncbi:hypothetical protein QQF64_004835 [Cirrhinus molitorella]|uniref:Uncharacterized protein n=1 Tax=Cirrhinus molitorella TaxID=172907 RepID=A0ABR3MHL6_9TELE